VPAPRAAVAASSSAWQADDDALTRARLRGTALIADTLLAAHWSLPGDGLRLSPTRIGLLGLYSGVVGLYLKWAATAPT